MRNRTVGINVRVTVTEKKKVTMLARKCGLSLSEYLRQRALGYEPSGHPPTEVFNVLDKLDVSANTDSLETKWVVAKREEGEEELYLRDLTIREGLVPNVIGMGAKDAVFLLESAGLRVVLDGMGRVSAQSMGAGTRIAKGQSIRLTLR